MIARPDPAFETKLSSMHGGNANGVAPPLQLLKLPPWQMHTIWHLAVPPPPPKPALLLKLQIPTPPDPPSVPAHVIKLPTNLSFNVYAASHLKGSAV